MNDDLREFMRYAARPTLGWIWLNPTDAEIADFIGSCADERMVRAALTTIVLRARAVLRDTPKVCPTCGSDDPKVANDPCDGWGDIDVAQEPDPFHSQGEPCLHPRLYGDSFSALRCVDCGTSVLTAQGEPCDLCGGTGWRQRYTHPLGIEPCPRGCTPEGEKK